MLRRLLICCAIAVSFVPAGGTAKAQAVQRAFSAFIDCSDFYCEPDFYRTEIAFVDHVRERTAADVHILITRQQTGGGGSSFTLAFYGQHRFAGIADTISINTKQGATEDENRQAIARTVKLGLARYLARTPDWERASLSVSAPVEGTTKAAPTHDPWNAWVFRIGANVNASRERDFQNNYVNGSVNASRVTEGWKTNMRVSENYNDQSFTIDGDKVTSVRRDFNGAIQQVRSFGEHWSAGLKANAGSSTYLNQHLAVTAAPAVEYDIFPYKEYTRRALMVQYSAGVKHFRYDDTTVYFKTRETLPFEAMNVVLSQKQKWGSLRFEVNGYHYLNDFGKSRLTFYSEADVRLIKGLSLNLFGDYSVLHDQLYLAKGGLSREEVLLQQSQLATTYRAFLYMGISYTFGSVLNNVVNPRFSNNNSDF
ncbi:MAG: hypothetical protein ABIY52_04015 [Gemmatimonadaceae bacterium]